LGWFHQLPIMPEDCCGRVAHLECKLCRVVEPGKVIRPRLWRNAWEALRSRGSEPLPLQFRPA
jgi:hypothetical protein